MSSATPEEFQMGLFDHLRELRRRLIICSVAILFGSIAAYCVAGEIFTLLCAPYYEAFPSAPLVGTSPSEAWILKIKVSIVAGALIVSPVLFLQVWLFIAPGLYESEKRLVIPFLVLSTLLFSVGAWFCYSVVLPFTFEFFRDQYTSIDLSPMIKIGDHLSLTLTAVLGFGAVFEMPILTFFLARMGLVDDKFLIRSFRHATLIIFVVAAILTPPEVLTQFLMAGPLMVLYGVSIIVARFAAPKPEIEASSSPALVPESDPTKNS